MAAKGVNANLLRQQVRDLLLQRIGDGQLEPGQRIIESKIAEELGVSSVPVREALLELVAMGVLDSAAHRGVRVREVRIPDTIEAFEVRGALEALAARKAAKRLRGRCEQLKAIAQEIVAAAQQRDFGAYQHHNQVFHRTFVEASGIAVLVKVWDSLGFEIRTRLTMDYLTTVAPVEIAVEHIPIVEALDQGRAEEAASLLASHSEELVQYLHRQLDAEESPAVREVSGT